MSFRNNLDYVYDLLPAYMRRDDASLPSPLFLKRFLSYFGQQMDGFDKVVDELHQQVAPETAPEEFLNFFLWAFFGWGWFPVWTTLGQKRQFYADVATHYARRGTARGIEEFLAAFGIASRVTTQPPFYEEWTPEEGEWIVETPLVLIVQIYPPQSLESADLSFYEEWTLEESAVFDPPLVPGQPEIDALLRFQEPVGQVIIVEELIG